MAVSEIVSTGCVHAKSRQSCPTFCDPMDYSPTGSSVHVDSPGKNTGVGCHVSSRGSSRPTDQTVSLLSPALVGGFLTTSTTWETHPQGLTG